MSSKQETGWWVLLAASAVWALLCLWWAVRDNEYSGAYVFLRLPGHFLYRFEGPVTLLYLLVAGPLGRRQPGHGLRWDALAALGLLQWASLAACVHYTEAIEYATGWYRDQWLAFPLGIGCLAMGLAMYLTRPRSPRTPA